MTATAPADLTPRVRDLDFAMSAHWNTHWFRGDPVGTAVFNALSLTFPDGERMFMDAVRHYRKQVPVSLQEEVKAFLHQEAIHAREHQALNALIDRSRYDVAGVEASIRRNIQLGRDRGPLSMLMATTVLEHLTAVMADVHQRHGHRIWAGVPEPLERLWRWHSLEETEHKAVAFDVLRVVTAHWSPRKFHVRRVLSMLLISYFFPRNITRHAVQLLAGDGMGRWEATRKVLRFLWWSPGIFRLGWRHYLAWFRPGFHPWGHGELDRFREWRREFDAEAEAVPARFPAAAG